MLIFWILSLLRGFSSKFNSMYLFLSFEPICLSSLSKNLQYSRVPIICYWILKHWTENYFNSISSQLIFIFKVPTANKLMPNFNPYPVLVKPYKHYARFTFTNIGEEIWGHIKVEFVTNAIKNEYNIAISTQIFGLFFQFSFYDGESGASWRL